MDALELSGVRAVLADHRSAPVDRVPRYLTKCLFGRLSELGVNEEELITEVAGWFEKRLSKDEVLKRDLLEVINKVACITRHETRNIWTTRMSEWRNSGGLTTMEFTVDTILLERRRFVFDHNTMGRLIEKTSSHHDNTATAMALRGASLVGGAAPDKNAEIPQEIKDACKKADSPEATEVRDIVLQALDTSPDGANFAEETLECIQKYEQANSVYNYNAPNNILLLSRKARAFQRAGKFEDAMKTISLAIEKNKDQSEYARGMAEKLAPPPARRDHRIPGIRLLVRVREGSDRPGQEDGKSRPQGAQRKYIAFHRSARPILQRSRFCGGLRFDRREHDHTVDGIAHRRGSLGGTARFRGSPHRIYAAAHRSSRDGPPAPRIGRMVVRAVPRSDRHRTRGTVADHLSRRQWDHHRSRPYAEHHELRSGRRPPSFGAPRWSARIAA